MVGRMSSRSEQSPLLAADPIAQQVQQDDRQKQPSKNTIVSTMFIMGILTMVSFSALRPSMLLYTNYYGITSADNISAFVTATSIIYAVPIFSNIAVTKLAAKCGAAYAITTSALVSATGVLVLICSQGNIFLFFISYALFAVCLSMRPVRVSLIARVVPQHDRTAVLATHALMTPLGGVIGPLVWITALTYRDSVVLMGSVKLNKFVIDYVVVMASLLIIACISWVVLSDVGRDLGGSSSSSSSSSTRNDTLGDGANTVRLSMEDGREKVVDLRTYRNNVFRYFCAITFLVNVSTGLFFTTFQPVMVNVFHATDAELGVAFGFVGFFAIIPPLVIACLCRHLEDRQIILSGLVIKMLGMALYLPIFDRVKVWQVEAGMLLVVKASIFFTTVSMSLYTKLVGRMSKPSDIGVLMSLSTLGPAITQIALSEQLVALFGTFWFGLFAIPAGIGLAMICHRTHWKKLDSEREEVKLLMAQVERIDGYV